MTGSFTGVERREIAGRARTLHERLAGPRNEPGSQPPFDPDEVIENWQEAFPDDSAFEERLDREGIEESTIREQASATRWPGDEPLPAWIDDLESVVAHVETAGTGGTVRVGESDGELAIPEDVPFVDLLAPIADYACERLPEDVPLDVLGPMVEWLGQRLRQLTRQALFVEFKSFLTHHDPELAHADPDEVEDPPTDLYETFVDAMLDGGMANLCLEYPVLARHLVAVVTNWREAVAETWRRLESDRDDLAERFDVAGSVTALDPLSRETHASGRVPVQVDFESGSVVYKPRPVDAGVVLYEALDLVDEHLPWSPFRRPEYLPREGYGWMAFVEYRDPDDVPGVKRFYERGGALLCLAYVLRMNDCQYENLIVDGDQPTILDGETVFRPALAPSDTPLPAGVHAAMDESVLLTGMPPFGVGTPGDADDDSRRPPTAGFGDGVGEIGLGHRAQPVIVAPNTDVMGVEEQVPKIDRTDNVPTVDGEHHTPDGYVDEIVAGFERTYDVVRELHGDGRFDGILDRAAADGIETRLVYRATGWYGDVLRAAEGKDALRDGGMLTIEFEELASSFFDGDVTDRYWPLYGAERRALRQRDVPRFSITPGGSTISRDGRTLDAELEQSGIESVRRRLDALDDRDRRRQAWLLRRCYDPLGEPSMDVSPVDPTDDLLTETAVDLGEDVVDAALDAGSGREWISMSSGGDGTTLKLVPVGESLYDGRAGIGLALAALSATTGRERFRRMAVETLDAVVETLDAGSAASTLGGMAGLGSATYALAVAGDLLEEKRYVRAAIDLTGRITDDVLAADDTFDVMRGSAGSLLALLALYERHETGEVLDRAIACGDRLLEAREEVDGHRVWVTVDDAPTLGFSHGTSGIAYALARLAAATGDDRYETATREVLAYEDTLYSQERDNWPRRDTDDAGYVDQWCYGRAGIALARVGIGDYLDDPSLLEAAAAHVDVTSEEGFEELDKLCCGNFGKGMTILETARRTGGDTDDARRFVGRSLARRHRDGSFGIAGHSTSVTDPTFFRGTSGIAYSLLRLRDPDRLPCVLLLE